MKLQQIQCPGCGAEIEIPEGRDKFFCQYCGASIYVDDEVERKEYTIRHIDQHIETDEADIERTRAEIELRKMEMEESKRGNRMIIFFLIAAFLAAFAAYMLLRG